MVLTLNKLKGSDFMDIPTLIIVIFAGIFSIAGGVCDWDFFMNSRKARFIVTGFGRNGARIFYVCLGVIIIIMAAPAKLL